MWVIRGGEDNRLVDQFVDQGITAVGYPSIGDGWGLTEPVVAATLRAEKVPAAEAAASRFRQFVHDVAHGDVVVMPDTPRGEVVVGIVEGDYEFHPEVEPEAYRHRRVVRWIGRHGTADLPTEWQSLYRQRQTVRLLADADALVEHAARIEADRVGRPAADRGKAPAKAPASVASTRAPKVVSVFRRCPECGLQKAPSQFGSEELCADCR